LSEDVALAYDESKERLQYADWKVDRAMAAIFEARRHRPISGATSAEVK